MKGFWDPAILAVNPDFEDTTGLQLIYLVFHLVAAILAVWLYSAIRPRLGAGPKTALIAGLFVWFFYGLCFGLNAGAMGLIPTNVLVADSLTTLVQYVVATLAGAWVYKEQS